ncbi:hypothetical protein U1121_06810 [Listeria monocytogenes]
MNAFFVWLDIKTLPTCDQVGEHDSSEKALKKLQKEKDEALSKLDEYVQKEQTAEWHSKLKESGVKEVLLLAVLNMLLFTFMRQVPLDKVTDGYINIVFIMIFL